MGGVYTTGDSSETGRVKKNPRLSPNHRKREARRLGWDTL